MGGRYAFNPHLTPAYEPQPIDDAPQNAPIHWSVRDFALVHSFQGQTRHDHVARFALI